MKAAEFWDRHGINEMFAQIARPVVVVPRPVAMKATKGDALRPPRQPYKHTKKRAPRPSRSPQKLHPLTWGTWRAMIRRCENQNHQAYPMYGGRGIRLCERWRRSFKDFLADMGERPSFYYTIDRIDVDGHYEPGNCKWATPREQNRNKRRPPSPFEIALAGSCLTDHDSSGDPLPCPKCQGVSFHIDPCQG